MAWALLDDNFPAHPKVLEANRVHALAGYLFVCGLCYCRKYRTSGFIPAHALRSLGLPTSHKKPADALVAANLWELAAGGYHVHGYIEQYDDAAELEAKAARRAQKQEAGRKGGQASWAKRNAVSALSETEAPTSQSAEPLMGRGGNGSVGVLSKEKERGPRDAWWLELLRRYPSNRAMRSHLVQAQFSHLFDGDPRPDAELWAEILEGLENACAGHEWRVKGMAPRLDRWLERKGWCDRHEVHPVSVLVSDKTARTLSSAQVFVTGGGE